MIQCMRLRADSHIGGEGLQMNEHRIEIERLLYRYAELIDLGQLEALADLFEHAVITSPGLPVGPGGRAAALEMYTKSTRLYEDGTPRTKHVTTNIVVDVDASSNTAQARSYFTVFQALEDFPLQAIIAGRYEDKFNRVDGSWRFSERMMIPELMGDLRRHLLIEI
jgi:3-phenylpropionate/cinnamic acid dioxygenase small subunit